MTRAQIADARGLTVNDLHAMDVAGLLSPDQVCTAPAKVLRKAKAKAAAPKPDQPD